MLLTVYGILAAIGVGCYMYCFVAWLTGDIKDPVVPYLWLTMRITLVPCLVIAVYWLLNYWITGQRP